MMDRDIEHSVGGFLEVPGSGRVVHNFNVGWRFRKGAAEGAEAVAFDDGDWPVVSAPHGLEVLPLEASGGVNYQGEAWYRKRFAAPAELEGHFLLWYTGDAEGSVSPNRIGMAEGRANI